MERVKRICEKALERIKDKEGIYTLEKIQNEIKTHLVDNMDDYKLREIIIQVGLELTSVSEPRWHFLSSYLFVDKLYEDVCENRGIDNREIVYKGLYEFIESLTKEGLYGKYILDNYSKKEIEELEGTIVSERDYLFTYAGISLLSKRYLIQSYNRQVIELPQQMFMGIAMHLAIPEKKEKRVYWAKRFYNVLSTLKATMATPTMANGRRPFYQLSSCFIDTVEDSLKGIYKSLDNFAQVSKFGGGMGIYLGKVRALESSIRGYKGASGGIIPWIKLFNDTAIAVDQLGVRSGSVAIYLDAWHKDIPEFLQIKTNNGDDRKKAHDVFPGICYPKLFWDMAKNNIDGKWHFMCPHEIRQIKGYSLEDYYGEEWEVKYKECIEDSRISKRTMIIKDVVRLIIKSVAETGTPFAFYRDEANKMNPNKHKGMIYSSNLCTEIMQNMSPMKIESSKIVDKNGDTIIIEKTRPGDFVVCNLSSLVLGKINVLDEEELEYIVETQIRAMDNVIDLNYYPVPYAEVTNKKYRAIGLGTSGYHHMLAKNKIGWTSEEHLKFTDNVYENINYFAIKASMNIAKEKGYYECFNGSDWQNGDYFKLRNYNSSKWNNLKQQVQEVGIRNGYLLAVAPNGSTATIAGTSEGVDPIMSKYYLEEKKGNVVPKTAPELSKENFWFYNDAYNINQQLLVKVNGIRQRHIDQGQSFNLYITTDCTMREVMNLYIAGNESGLKSIYYVRSKSLKVDECESCSA